MKCAVAADTSHRSPDRYTGGSSPAGRATRRNCSIVVAANRSVESNSSESRAMNCRLDHYLRVRYPDTGWSVFACSC